MNGSNQIQIRNRIGGRNRREQPRLDERWKGEGREVSGTVLSKPNQQIQEHTKKEKRESYCLLSCRTQLDTVHMLYPSIGNSYTSSSPS
mmetsp:Transcript_52036/g.60136  ORF Transcript_52036/g.60136 Transcript_52036/m.60136 type:complete len:89 (+) Transcript_52036:3-269(+)